MLDDSLEVAKHLWGGLVWNTSTLGLLGSETRFLSSAGSIPLSSNRNQGAGKSYMKQKTGFGISSHKFQFFEIASPRSLLVAKTTRKPTATPSLYLGLQVRMLAVSASGTSFQRGWIINSAGVFGLGKALVGKLERKHPLESKRQWIGCRAQY